MAKRVVIPGLTVREAQIALLDAVNEKVLYKLAQWSDGDIVAYFIDTPAQFNLTPDGEDIIMVDPRNGSDETAWRVTEGILRLAAAAKRNASK